MRLPCGRKPWKTGSSSSICDWVACVGGSWVQVRRGITGSAGGKSRHDRPFHRGVSHSRSTLLQRLRNRILCNYNWQTFSFSDVQNRNIKNIESLQILTFPCRCVWGIVRHKLCTNVRDRFRYNLLSIIFARQYVYRNASCCENPDLTDYWTVNLKVFSYVWGPTGFLTLF